MVEWGRLLSGYRGEILGRRFESCPPRHNKTRQSGVFCLKHKNDEVDKGKEST